MSSFDTIVVGAGISGLAAAETLRLAGQNVLVVEASERPGGRIRSVSHEGDMAEAGGQGIHSNYTEMLKLLDDYDLTADLIPAPEKLLYLDRKGRPRHSRVKEDLPLMLGPRGAADLVAFTARYFAPGRAQSQFEVVRENPEWDDRTAAALLDRYSPAFADFVVRPMTHAMANTTPEACNLYYLLNGVQLALTTSISSLRGGNERLPALMAQRNRVRLGARVERVLSTGGVVDGVRLDGGEALRAKHVIVTTPAVAAGPMLTDEFHPFKDYLSGFPVVPLPLAFFFLDRPLAGDTARFFGHPFRDATFNMAVNHARKSPHMVPSGRALISAWPTFPQTAELMRKTDDEIIREALADLEVFVPGMGGWIAHATVVRHEVGVARYPKGSVRDILTFKAWAEGLKGISFAGTDYDFLHMEAGIRSAQRAARRALAG